MDMDYYETLDILRPPVKRDYRDIQQQYIGYVGSGTENVNLCAPATLIKTEQKTALKERPVESSLSLILQKTCRKQILQKFSFCNSGNPKDKKVKESPDASNKPLIRITVLPKPDHKPLFKFLETHGQAATHDIQSENVYIVVAGTEDEKIYEINTKSCAKIHKDEDVKELFNNIKHTVKNKKMEKKKKKSKKQEDTNFYNSPNLCKCTRDNLTQDICGEPSRVKIIGRIGLNEDDEYVMRCAATINGQPVSTQCNDEEKFPFQFDFADDRSIEPLKESQGTQADIDIGIPHETIDQNIQCGSYDVYSSSIENNIGEEFKLNNLKASNPLVIISVYPKHEINNFAAPTKCISPDRLGTQNYRLFQDNDTEDFKINTFTINSGLTSLRKPSPDRPTMLSCQICEGNKNEDVKGNNTTIKQQTNRSSRERTKTDPRAPSPVNRSPKSKTQERKKQSMLAETNAVKTIAWTQSPNKFNVYDKKQQKGTVTKQSRKVVVNKNKTERKQQNSTMRSESMSRNKSVNTNRLQTNNVSPERFTKKLSNNNKKNMKKKINVVDDQTVFKKSYPNNDVSKVSINIDGENDYYDVVFEKGRLSTDLSVRKTTKENSSQKYFEESFEKKYEKNNENNYENNYDKNSEKNYDSNYESNLEDIHVSDSLENFFPLEVTGRHRRSVSQAFNTVVDGIPLSEHTSRINVRDSLEIGHRRDGKDAKPQTSKRLFEYSSQEDVASPAPAKHFSGDSCSVSDPVARDKEIRELLGIDKKRTDSRQPDPLMHKVHGKEHKAPRHVHGTLCESFGNKRITKKINSIYKPKEGEVTSTVYEDILIPNNSVPKPRKLAQKEFNDINGTSVMKNQLTQYNSLEIKSSKEKHSIQSSIHLETNSPHKTILLSRKQYNKVKKLIHKGSGKRAKGKAIWNTCVVSVGNVTAKIKSEYVMHWNKEVQTEPQTLQTLNIKDVKIQKRKESKVTVRDQINTVVLFSRDKYVEKANSSVKKEKVRKIASSVEIRYTSLSFMKEVDCSVTNSETLGSSKLQKKKNKSIETIFKGYKRSLTPNLGTSAFSLLTEDAKSVSKTESLSPNLKQKKPFFRRLMSCLVLRSTVKIDQTKKLEPPTMMNSSIDSYHISTSLGAIEVTSSLYDTSASFYSNHTINNKMKRGFFSSVREFLSTKYTK